MSRGISRRRFIQAGVTGAVALSLGKYITAAPAANSKPNVLIITTDQQRVDAMVVLQLGD